jgi:tetratricopeptide (TPR) repeat protein
MVGIVNTVSFRPFQITFLLLLLAPAAPVRAADANQNWVEVRSPHFTVASNASEKDGRRIAEQFEQIRAMFHAAFATFRVDPAQPILILAAKNEGTMKLLLPEEWEAKGHIHHAGMYQQGEDKHYVLLQLDAEGNNPFHVVYHEYTHALLHLNFSSLPLWLDEGLAEFFGNSTLGEKESKTGTIDSGTLYFLQQNRLLPIETLVQVDHTSPHYNEANRASVFYAESWALVHYLMMNPEARQRQLLTKFIAAWEKSQNQVEAAQQTFGDLKRFGQVLEGYSRQASFMVGVVKMEQAEASKSYAARHLSAAEVLTWRGDFAAHHNRLEQAKPLLEEAIQLEPNLATARAGLGYYYYRRQEYGKADAQMKEALARGDASFAAAYFHGMLLTRESSSNEMNQEAVDSLKKATQLNPQFAPAFDALAHAYSQSLETQKQALGAAFTAVKLDPAEHQYVFHLISVLMNSDRDADARYLAQKIIATANSPGEKESAEFLLNRIQDHEKWVAQRKERGESSSGQGGAPGTQPDAAGAGKVGGSSAPEAVPLKSTTTMAAEGKIHEVTCGHPPEITLTLDFSGSVLVLHSTNLEEAEVTAAKGQSAMGLDNCRQWIGRRVKVWFHLNQSKEYFGEITKIYFF